jgi:hypothetical protein
LFLLALDAFQFVPQGSANQFSAGDADLISQFGAGLGQIIRQLQRDGDHGRSR